MRISNELRDDNWVTTEFNNQSDPDTPVTGFYKVGAVETIS